MKGFFIISIIFSIYLPGCTSSSRVSDYSKSALKTIKKYEELNYTFDKACRDKCFLEQVRNTTLSNEGCLCAREQTADSVASVLYKAIKAYYDGLVKLSANDVTTYKAQALTKELKSGSFADLNIEKVHIDAYSKLSTLLLKAFSDKYRRRKINEYIEVANEPIQILITALEVNLGTNLKGKLNVHKARMQSIYFDFLQDSTASAFEKKNAIHEYNVHLNEANASHEQVSTYARGLKSIRAGHQKLYDNRNKVNRKEMKAMLAEYASDLEDILSDFNKIKNK